MAEVVPVSIRPRETTGSGSKFKAPVGSSTSDLHWHRWSYQVIHQLEKLSYRTTGKLTFAQELMILEVRQRQQDGKNPMRAVAEILLQDLQRIVRELAETSTNLGKDDFSDRSEASDDKDEDDVDQVENGNNRSDSVTLIDDQQEVKTEDESINLNNGIAGEGSGTTIVKIEDSSAKTRNKKLSSHRVPKSKAKILLLRADAMR